MLRVDCVQVRPETWHFNHMEELQWCYPYWINLSVFPEVTGLGGNKSLLSQAGKKMCALDLPDLLSSLSPEQLNSNQDNTISDQSYFLFEKPVLKSQKKTKKMHFKTASEWTVGRFVHSRHSSLSQQ